MSKAPAFQLYVTDLLTDANTIVMTTEEFGAYTLLFCLCWWEGSLEDNLDDLARIARCPRQKFLKIWNKRLQKCFRKFNGRWIHPRLEKERIKQKEYKEKQILNGKIGAEKRWGRHSDPMATLSPDPIGSPYRPHSSLSLSLTSLQKESEWKSLVQDKSNTSTLTHEEFVEELKKNPAYDGINIDHELSKLDGWLLTDRGQKKKKTKQTILWWLAHADKTAPAAPKKKREPEQCYFCGKASHAQLGRTHYCDSHFDEARRKEGGG